ncbi:accessory Sec system protein Asp2 [Staphylococcus delphini]|uniref:Accessory Sec system protein Asp2 n=1 Tax=Staphylococcus delphini TaxID=53344 RepID=A0A2A4GVX2_9STAP|nr:accessory Sec system protein Asp2 [Staphylococcus delphini]PCF54395.1 accessory Sec system protein Asp2 [Staphylococcus delphini]PCF63104.1 accessory Sec system protein Asp2 [Staphylococcus delphini]PCF72052.1 accessory Sec system protein Asp2 [Staphylococcus delphini]HEC2158947.1 accessory Sec system protein Asp2 [Staphylococcus delphini]
MPRQFNVLQIGGRDLEQQFQHKANVTWDYFDISLFDFDSHYRQAIADVLDQNGGFDFVFVQTSFSYMLMDVLEQVSTPYNTYIDQQYWSRYFEAQAVVKENHIRPFIYEDEQALYEKLDAITFSGQYGDKISPKMATVNAKWMSNTTFFGNTQLIITGDFGDTFTPVLSWQNNLVYDKHKVIQIWPEFTLEDDVELRYTFRLIKSGTTDNVIEEITLLHYELDEPLEIAAKPFDAYISVSVKARGKGVIHIGAIHKRWSRLDMGQFILGGQRYSDSQRQEFMYYFNPGDLKPPLNVYFSGYRSAEGFEGFFMMKNLKAPFLLISDPRIEGGAFYLGSEAYQNKIVEVIQQSLIALEFEPHELILSGLSMGSFGALYYGLQLQPSAIIVGKPLINIGTIAQNMALLRPEDFGTALDVLLQSEGDASQKSINQLNETFWREIEQAHISQTTFGIAYMEHDDYDPNAYEDLLPYLTAQQARVMTRSVPGRHNDDSPTITNWFVNFYQLILGTDYGRVYDHG